MRLIVLATAVLALGATPAGAQQAQADPSDDIVVRGVRISEAADALAACIARHCPPDQEIDATLALAQEQFEAGDYDAARSALAASRRRNARFAKRYPVSVANLHHASSVIARHMGLATREWSSSLEAVSAMKAGLPEDDPRIFVERLELGDSYARGGRYQAAEEQYRAVAKRAGQLGLRRIEGSALLRTAILNTHLVQRDNPADRRRAERAIDDLIARTDPAYADFASAARQLRVQLAGTQGRAAGLEDAVATHGAITEGEEPRLLYVPPIEFPSSGSELFGATAGMLNDTSFASMAKDSFEGQWIDIAFTIGTDGRISDAHIARQSDNLRGEWPKYIIASVAGRRYAPQPKPGSRLERFSFTSNWGRRTGTNIRARSPVPRIERMDLTP